MPYVGQTITEVFHTSISVDSATIKGDTTIGDASAADKKILFDGNAVDYHIGLDDSADSLIIGKGSALGTTTSMAIDANGIITKPLQPSFQVNKNDTSQNNIATDTAVVVTWEIERFDVNSDFDLTNNQFTAPVTGKYFLSANIRVDSVDTGANFYNIMISTSNKNYTSIIDPNFSADVDYITRTVAITADMDAGDTAQVKAVQSGGTAQADLDGASEYSSFSGHLVC